MAESAAHVTMLQRSPSLHRLAARRRPGRQAAASLSVGSSVSYPIMRWKNVLMTMASFQLSRRRPKAMKAVLRKGLERQLPTGYDIETHFNPSYNPWDQRLCLVPNGDLFESISAGRASVVTDRIERFTETGHQACLRSRARGRCDRHCHRSEPRRIGWHAVLCGRSRGGRSPTR